jgi:hypothetical protein
LPPLAIVLGTRYLVWIYNGWVSTPAQGLHTCDIHRHLDECIDYIVGTPAQGLSTCDLPEFVLADGLSIVGTPAQGLHTCDSANHANNCSTQALLQRPRRGFIPVTCPPGQAFERSYLVATPVQGLHTCDAKLLDDTSSVD